MRILKIDGVKVIDTDRTKHRIGYQDQLNHVRWYVSDLPGHVGTAKIKQGSDQGTASQNVVRKYYCNAPEWAYTGIRK
jgi:hypothetical protein